MPSTRTSALPVAGRDAHELACILKYQFSHCSLESGEFFLVPRLRAVGTFGAGRGNGAITVSCAHDISGLTFAKNGRC
jgi:hypothetical protein